MVKSDTIERAVDGIAACPPLLTRHLNGAGAMPMSYRTVSSGIYAIRHIDSGKLYIGSAVNLSNRWRTHRGYLNRGTHHSRYLQNAWNRHGADTFVFEVLEFVEDKADLIRAEQRWLDHVKPWQSGIGYNTSPTAGSCLGVKQTAETRAKLSAIKRNQSIETRAKIGEANRRRVLTPETRARMSASQKARAPESFAGVTAASRNRSDETRAKMAEAARNRSPEHRAKLGAAKKGKRLTLEHRAKLSAAGRGRPVSAETRAKMSASMKVTLARKQAESSAASR